MIDDKEDAKEVFKRWLENVIPILVFGGMMTVNVLSFKFLRVASILIIAPLLIIFALVFMDDYVDSFFEYIFSDDEQNSEENDEEENSMSETYFSFDD